MNKKCFGCGCILQSEDINLKGYIPKEKINDSIYCQRCFKLTHYGIKDLSLANKNNAELIDLVNKDKKFVIFMVDFLSISNKVLDIFKKIKNDKLLLISKSDIIPRYVKYEKIINNLNSKYNIISDINFISEKDDSKVKIILNYLKKNNIKETYILGLSNSGKSTFINKILKLNNIDTMLTTSDMPNTTLDINKIKINDELTIFDTPGFIIPLVKEGNSKSKKIIKPITFNMKDNEILKINDYYLKFKNKTSITIYANNNLMIKKCFKDDLTFHESFNINDNTDLVILGLGFINIKNNNLLASININSDLIELRESMFGE